MRALIAIAALAAACGDSGNGSSAEPAPRPTSRATAPAAIPDPQPEPTREPTPPAVEEMPDDVEEADYLRQLGARPVWSLAIDRQGAVRRRGQRAVAWGRVAARGDDLYLVDETEGDGCLGGLLEADGVPLSAGDRIVAFGAWRAEAEPPHRWVWIADRVVRLRDGAAPEASPYAVAVPSHDIETLAELPDGAVVIESLARDGGGTFFQVIAAPDRLGEGWLVAGRSHWPAAALLVLPGEREPYGGQDLLSESERWRLDKKQSYAVRVAPWRKPRKEGELPILQALSAPKRIHTK